MHKKIVSACSPNNTCNMHWVCIQYYIDKKFPDCYFYELGTSQSVECHKQIVNWILSAYMINELLQLTINYKCIRFIIY